MNIFMFNTDPIMSANDHCTRHTLKMIIEYAQLLSTAHHELDGMGRSDIYKTTHKNHPSAIWVRESADNYTYVWLMAKQLCKNYTTVSKKVHKTELVLDKLGSLPVNIPDTPMTPIKLAMPDQYKSSDPVKSYREYFKAEKTHLFEWKYSSRPEWV